MEITILLAIGVFFIIWCSKLENRIKRLELSNKKLQLSDEFILELLQTIQLLNKTKVIIKAKRKTK